MKINDYTMLTFQYFFLYLYKAEYYATVEELFLTLDTETAQRNKNPREGF